MYIALHSSSFFVLMIRNLNNRFVNVCRKSSVAVDSIFEVSRTVEDLAFASKLENKQLLFHSSRVHNFVGILSRLVPWSYGKTVSLSDCRTTLVCYDFS